jgi:hypothetical protein
VNLAVDYFYVLVTPRLRSRYEKKKRKEAGE